MSGQDLQKTLSAMTTERKAELFDALFASERIRHIGSAKIGEFGLQHIGLELWDQFPNPPDDSAGRNYLLAYLETIAEYSP